MRLMLFWSSLGVIGYAYVLFPALVFLRGLLRHRPYRTAAITPRVSMIIAAHNEARGIAAKLDNILALDYPRDRLEVVIASDGSTDDTLAILGEYAGRGVRRLALPRVGKANALNAAVGVSSGEILVFSDANSIYAPDAIRKLVAPFADPEVGGVAGNQCYLTGGKGAADAGERGYWAFDRLMKRFQSGSGNAISATGAIYAIRRSLFRTVPGGVTDDFVTSTSVILQGYRLVFAPDAIAYEPVAGASGVEFGRKVRIITRGLRAVVTMRELLNPFRYGFYAIQLFSHKVLRRLVAVPLLVLLAISPSLWRRNLIYRLATVAQIGAYGCGILGLLLGDTRLGRLRIFALPSFFCLVNAAALRASINVLRGHRIDLWEPQRADTGAEAAAKP